METRCVNKIDELESLILEITNDSEFETDDLKEILDDLTNVQGKINEWLDEQKETQDYEAITVRAYVYDDNGMHNGYVRFKGTMENIASFIMQTDHKDVVITDELDNLIVKTNGIFVDKVYSQDFNILLLDKLIPLQYNETTPIEIEYIDEPYEMEFR